MSNHDLSAAIRAAEFLEEHLERLLAEKPEDLAIRYAYSHIRITILHLRHLLHTQNKESL